MLDDAGISDQRSTMNNNSNDPPQRRDAGRRLRDLADKCDAQGMPELAAQAKKGAEKFASDESNKSGFNWSPFTPLKDNKMWRRVLSIAVGVAFVVWAVVSIFVGHITVTHENLRYYIGKQPFGFWLVVAFILFLGLGCIYRGIQGKK